MTVITFTALERALGGTEPIATGRVTVDYLSGRYTQYVAVDGDEVTFPNQIGVPIVDGALTETLDVPGTGAVCCARIEIAADGARASLERFVTIPDSGTVDFGDLVDVDPDLFTPIDPTPNLVETIDDRIDLKLGDLDVGDLGTTIETLIDTKIAAVDAADVGAIPTSAKGAPSGVASLDGAGKVSTSQLPPIPASASDVGAIPATAAGATNGVATLSGGKVPSSQLPAIPASKADIGLPHVDDTSDADKPVSDAQAAALAAKADLDGAVFTGPVQVPTPASDADPKSAANMEFTQGLIDAINAVFTAVLKSVPIVIPYDPITGWPNRSDYIPAWLVGARALWDSFGYALTNDDAPPTIQEKDDWRRERVTS